MEVVKYRRVINKKRVALAAFILVLSIVLFAFTIYKFNISPVSRKNEEVIVTIEKGGISKTAKILKEKEVIRSAFMFKVYVYIHDVKNLQAATYKLNKAMNVKQIVNKLNKGESYNPNEVSITFKEGINIRKIASLIAEKTNNSYEDVIALSNDKEYINEIINKYWFLTEDIKNNNIYYSLEGYLFPDTYIFDNKDVTVKEIFNKMLDQMNLKLSKYQTDISKSNLSIHELITLASIVELEASSTSDRKDVSGVFINRLEGKWSLGSDVTSYYGAKVDDFSKSLSSSQLTECNNYNTRCTKQQGLPVGPIAIVSLDAITSTLNYNKHDYYFFVADCTGKTYLSKTDNEQANVIRKLKRDDNWCA